MSMGTLADATRAFELGTIYRGAGDHTADHPRSLEEIFGRLPAGTQSCVLLLYWPQEENAWWDLHVSWELAGNTADFSAASTDLVRLMQQGGVPEAQVRQALPDFQQKFHFRVAEVEPGAALRFFFHVNADHADFLEETEGTGPQIVLRELQRRIFPVPASASVEAAAAPLRLVLNAEEMPYFAGAAALDFGNTSSTLACLEAHDLDVQDIEVVDVQPRLDGPPGAATEDFSVEDGDHTVPSAVRLMKFEPTDSADELPEADWCIGRDALRRPDGELILGAKRLMADPRQSELCKVFLDQSSCEIPKNLAAELFVARVFQGFYTQHRKRTRRLALTYPATFSQQEISRLKQAVFRGLTRALLWPKYVKPDAALLERLFPVMLDEASAAAFFFIYRDFLRAPGRTNMFRYLYPEGINVLLYDCGGGTTDIALVHARPKRIVVEGQEPWEVDLRVLGRTGHRGFGGDNITAAVFRVLKAEIACHLTAQVNVSSKLTFPKDPKELQQFLARNERPIDFLVPTKFRDLSQAGTVKNLPEFKLRREATLQLWKWAEAVKVWLAREPKDRPSAPRWPQRSKLAALIVRHHANVNGDEFDSKAVMGAVIKTLGERRPFVDELIRADIQHTIEVTNRMIETRLTNPTRNPIVARLSSDRTEPPADAAAGPDRSSPAVDGPLAEYPLPPDSCVHWAYVVGKASRYPLVRSLLQEGLHVGQLAVESGPGDPDDAGDDGGGATPPPTPLDDRPPPDCRLRFDEHTLKTSVACGAALALQMRFQQTVVRINWDSDLARRLPYTIFHDSFGRGDSDLFLEHERYEDLKPQPISVAPQQQGITVTLRRRWPDGTTEKFLDFAFEQPNVGPLWVRYDSDDQCFKMLDERTEEEVIGVEIGQEVYVSPAQSGEL